MRQQAGALHLHVVDGEGRRGGERGKGQEEAPTASEYDTLLFSPHLCSGAISASSIPAHGRLQAGVVVWLRCGRRATGDGCSWGVEEGIFEDTRPTESASACCVC